MEFTYWKALTGQEGRCWHLSQSAAHVEAAFFFHRNPFYSTVCDINEAVLFQSAEKLVHVLFLSLQLHFDTAVVQIRDPAGQPQTLGQIVCSVTKAHTLDTAAYENVFSDDFSFFHLITFTPVI